MGTYEFENAGPLVVFAVGLGASAFTLGLFTLHVARAEHLCREGTTISTGCGGITAWSLLPSWWWLQERLSSIQP